MKRNYAIKKIAVFLNKSYNEIYRKLRHVNSQADLKLVLSSNIGTVTENVMCKDWTMFNLSNNLVFYNKDEILFAYPSLFLGKDKKIMTRHNIKHTIIKTSFRVDEELIVLKKNTENSHKTGYNDLVTYTLIVYKFNANHIGKIPQDKFDYSKQSYFSLNRFKKN